MSENTLIKEAVSEALASKDAIKAEIKAEVKTEVGELVATLIEEGKKSTSATDDDSPNAKGWVPASKMLPHYTPPENPEMLGVRFAMGLRAFVGSGKNMAGVPKFIHDRYKDPATAKYYEKSITTQNISSGGAFVADTILFSEMIPLMRARSFLTQAGAQVIMSDTDKVTIPGISSGFSTYFVGEKKRIKAATLKFNQVKLNARKNAGLLVISNDWLDEASPEIDMLVRDDCVKAVYEEIHVKALWGDGSEEQPLGLDHDPRCGDVTVNAFPDGDTLSKFMKAMMDKNIDFNPLTNGIVMGSDLYIIYWNMKDSFGKYRYREEMLRNRTDKTPWGTIEGTPVYVYTLIKPTSASNNPTSLYYGKWSELKILMRKAVELKEFDQATIVDENNETISAAQHDVTILRVKAKVDSRVREDGALQRSDDVHTVAGG